MRIVHVTTHCNMGGISKYIYSLSKALKTKGAEVVVVSSGGDMETSLADIDIAHRKIDINTKFEFGPRAIVSGFKLAGIVRKERADLIHAHTRVSQVAAAIASSMTGAPYVTTCHGYFKKRSRGIIDTWGVRVVAISDAVKRHLIDDLGVDASRIELIYSGIELERFSRAIRSEEVSAVKKSLGFNDEPVLGTVGRLSPVKGQRFLIEAMKEITSVVPEARCLLVGNGPEEASLKALVGSLGLKGSVRFVESCDDTHKYLSAMDIFVFPSLKEGLGIALLEAMASGRACIASRTGGIEDIIEDGKDGILVDAGDKSAITSSAVNLLNDGPLRDKLGKAARETAVRRFDINSMADNMKKLYDGTIG